MSKKVIIETDECIGCETCVELCPEVFEFDEADQQISVPTDKYENFIDRLEKKFEKQEG
jgi:ferredoxin